MLKSQIFRCACACVCFFFLSLHHFIFYFFFWHLFLTSCSATWLNCAGVRNLFEFKQDALIAEGQSQITSIHPSESYVIGVQGIKGCFCFIQMPDIDSNVDTSSHHEQVWMFTLFAFRCDCCRALCFLTCLCLLASHCDEM